MKGGVKVGNFSSVTPVKDLLNSAESKNNLLIQSIEEAVTLMQVGGFIIALSVVDTSSQKF